MSNFYQTDPGNGRFTLYFVKTPFLTKGIYPLYYH
jgi:hypothetical protein